MKQPIKSIIMAFILGTGATAMAEVNWKPYSNEDFLEARKGGKTVLLGFHKKGCGTCAAQDSALEEAGVNKLSDLVLLRVERKDKKMDVIFEQYGLNNNQWGEMLIIKGIGAGTTDKSKIKEFLAKAN